MEQESSKRQKVDDDKETSELKSLMEVIPDEEEVTLDAFPLAVKSLSIVDWKIHKEGKKSYYQIIRADGSSKMYLVFSHMLKNSDKEDLETLYKLVKAKYGSTRPVENLDLVLYGDLKTMFEPHMEDNVWKNQSDYRVLNWKLYDSCGVHCVTIQNMLFYLLVEKMYPLTNHTLHQMFNDVKLQVDYECEMAFELLRLVKKQFKECYGRIVRIKSLLEVTTTKVCVTAAKLKFMWMTSFLGQPKKAWCEEFEVLMKGEFEMSAMGEMSFFLGLQVKQLPDGIFISQDKYVKDMLTKFDMESVRTATTPYEAAKTKLKDEADPPVNCLFQTSSYSTHFSSEFIESADLIYRQCPKLPKDKNQRAFVRGSWSDSGEEDDEKVKDETCLVAQASNEICLEVDLKPDEWIKNSGCSKHMTGNRKLFSTYKAYNGGNIIFGSNFRGNIIGKGTISNDSLKIDNVEHVDNLRFNLLSVGKICNNKCRLTFSEYNSEITKDGKVIGRGIRNKGLYVMKLGNKPKDKIYLAMIDENSTLWHRRLGHANMRLIQSLAYMELVRDLPKLKFDQYFCDACKIGKQAHVSHKAKNIISMTRCLELLHMDLFGRKPTLDYFRVFRSKCFILNTKDYLTKFEPKSYEGVFLGYSQNSKAYIILNKHTRKIEESLNVTFDETPPPSKTSPLVDDDLDEEEAIRATEKKNLENDVEDETLEIDEVVNIKESMNHPLENIIENLNQRTLRSQAQNQSNFFCFISTIEPKNVNEALTDKSWIVAMKEELNQFIANDGWELVIQPRNMTIIGTQWLFRNKLDENGVVSQIRLVRDEHGGELNFFIGLQIKQMEDGIFFNQSKYIKEMLKKFGLEDSKPMKTPMSSNTKLTKDEECESVDSTKYRGMIGSLLYLTASRPDIMFSVCLCARFQEAPKTSHLEEVKRIFRYIKGTTHLGL
ncbi:retrovirus-related pol polyprotein from transposon TNT 1-94 [Tanacetum coccineum]